jgi:hypothetical protein
MSSTNPVRKRSLIKDSVLDHNAQTDGQHAASVKRPELTNEARVVSRARVTLPKPLPKGNAPTLA